MDIKSETWVPHFLMIDKKKIGCRVAVPTVSESNETASLGGIKSFGTMPHHEYFMLMNRDDRNEPFDLRIEGSLPCSMLVFFESF